VRTETTEYRVGDLVIWGLTRSSELHVIVGRDSKESLLPDEHYELFDPRDLTTIVTFRDSDLLSLIER